MSALFAEIGVYLIGAIAAALAVFGYGIKKKSDGVKQEKAENNSKVLNNVIDAHKNDAKVNKASESELDSIGKQWMRDE